MGGIGTCCRGELVLPTESVKGKGKVGRERRRRGVGVIMNCHSGSDCFCFVLFCSSTTPRGRERGEGGTRGVV